MLQTLRKTANKQDIFEDENSFTDEDFQSLSSVTKDQFAELFTYCDPVRQEHGIRFINKKDLLMFLCKLKQGLSDEFLKVIFRYSSRQNVSLTITNVRQSLMQRFVPSNIGLQAITRNEYITRHVTEFANELYNPEPNVVRAIA